MPRAAASFRAKLALASVATLFAAAAGALAWRLLRPAGVEVTATGAGATETTWRGQDAYVVDPVAGLRPRRSATIAHPMTGLDLSDPQQIEKRRDAHAFLRATELPSPLDRPSALFVGDSHLDGVVSTDDNATTLLERGSEAAGAPCYCLNAGCGLYSLWQSALRARDLLPQWRPRAVVVIVFLGNDFLDLDDPTVPHLDDALQEQPGDERAAKGGAADRQRAIGLQAPHEQLFWQGLNQAEWLRRDPTRHDAWLRKAAHAVATLETAAAAHGARVLWTLLPSFDLVFPEQAANLSAGAKVAVASGAQRRLRDGFAALLAGRGATVVDVEPLFAADGKLDVYALDFHVYRKGHRLLAAALQQPLGAALAR
jgi:hypothetical protein